MANYAMAIDYKNCINCQACETACKHENDVPLTTDAYRIWVGVPETSGTFPDLNLAQMRFMPSQCQQCENAPCQEVCPTSATYTDENGVIRVDEGKCIMCTYCITACPYDARYVDPRTHTVNKCNFCSDTRLARGESTTACQATCPTKVRIFGDLDHPESELVQILKKHEYKTMKTHMGTKPKLFYLL